MNQDTHNTTNISGPITNESGSMAIGSGATVHHYAQPTTRTKEAEQINVLFVLSNPLGTDNLRLNTEMRAIEQALQSAQQKGSIHYRMLPAATAQDLRRALLEKTYQIIHFMGHGASGGFLLENEYGQPHLVPLASLAMHFQTSKQTPHCVFFNACYTFDPDQPVTLHVPFVIAMQDAISDHAAIEFARGFYDAIGASKDIERAYQEGQSAVRFDDPNYQLQAVLLRA